MKRNRIVLLLVIVIAAVAGGIAGALLFEPAEPPPLVTGTQLSEPRPLPEFELVQGDGSSFTRNDFEGQWQLVFFGFTHCPDVCPNTLFLLDRVVDEVKARGAVAPRVVFVSVDPERDSPADVKQYVEYFDQNFVGVTANDVAIENLQQLTRALSVAYEFHREGDSYEVIHSSAVLLVDPQARLHAIFTPPLKAAEISTDLARLLAD